MMSNLITPHHFALEETDLQVREGGGGGRHTDPEIRGRGCGCGLNFFWAIRASVWSKNKGGGGVHGSVTARVFNYAATVYSEIT